MKLINKLLAKRDERVTNDAVTMTIAALEYEIDEILSPEHLGSSSMITPLHMKACEIVEKCRK